MLLFKDKPQFQKGFRVIADGPVEAVAPPPEYDLVIVGNSGYLTRHNPEDVTIRSDAIHVKGPRDGEWTKYPVAGIAYYGKELKNNGKDAA